MLLEYRKEKMEKRNGSLDLIKFLLAVSLVLFHGRAIMSNLSGGYMARGASAVEGFFIIAGFFMAHTALRTETGTVSYIWKRYKDVFPAHTVAFIFSFITICIRSGYMISHNLRSIIGLVIRAVPEFLIFAPLAGLQYSLAHINGIEWYLSAMLLGMAIIYPFLYKFKRNYCLILGPLIFLFLSGYLFQTAGSYRRTYGMTGLVCGGLIRAIASMSLGTAAYGILQEVKTAIRQTTCNRILVTVFSILCWSVTFYYLNSTLPKYYEFTVIYFTAGGGSLFRTGNVLSVPSVKQ